MRLRNAKTIVPLLAGLSLAGIGAVQTDDVTWTITLLEPVNAALVR